MCQVCIGARRLDKLCEVQQSASDKYQESPGTIICTTCDVTKREDVKNLVKAAEEKLGDVDVIINCAGM